MNKEDFRELWEKISGFFIEENDVFTRRDVFSRLYQMDPDMVDLIFKTFEEKTYKAGTLFHKSGRISNKLGFMIKGAAYLTFKEDNKIYVDEIIFENFFFADYFSYLTETKSKQDIIFLEDSVVLETQLDQIEELYKKDIRFVYVAKAITEIMFLNWQQKYRSLKTEDAYTRYVNLVKKNRKLLQRVPQYLIASYLNVSPETLSRIRKKYSYAK